MKKNILFFIFLSSSILFINGNSYGQDKQIICSEKTFSTPDCLKNCILKECSSYEEKEKAFSILIEKWKNRDGSLSFELSDIFLDILIHDYHFFFAEMKKNPKDFDAWVNELGDLSFAWFKEPPSPLENKRQELIQFLKNIKDLKNDTEFLRIKLLNTLLLISPRQID